MISEPTLFILGAGASVPYGYPTGAGLREQIIKEFYDNIEDVASKIVLFPLLDKEDVLKLARKFREVFNASTLYSIDKFLSFNPSFSDIGKIAITLQILESECKRKLKEDACRTLDWFELLFDRMLSTLKKSEDFSEFGKNKVSFITFNYDRSLEYFLYTGFVNSFHDKQSEFRHEYNEEGLKRYIPFPIIHVYGQIDKIGLYSSPYGDNTIKYRRLNELYKNIRVIGEERDKDIELKKEIAKLINNSKRIFFLGFGYAEENLDALGFSDEVYQNCSIYGTAYGKTAKEIIGIRSSLNKEIRSALEAEVHINPCIEDMDCKELLKKYL